MKKEFVEYIKEHIREYLPPDYGDADVTVSEVTKGNDRKLTGLIIRKPGEIAAPSIYLEHYGAQFEAGRSVSGIMREIAQIRMVSTAEVSAYAMDLKDYEMVRPMLSVRLCDPDKNREYLKDKPFASCGALAAAYRVRLADGESSVAVTDHLMELWGITREQLHQDALAAETARNPACFYTMQDVMEEIMLFTEPVNLFDRPGPIEAGDVPMYVLTNQSRDDGAGVLAREGVLDKVGEMLGSDFYVLPSSRHEVIIVPDSEDMQVEFLEGLVRDVNETQVPPEEWLSDKVQHYDREAKTLGRKQEKGILERLSENKMQVQEAVKKPEERHTAKQEPVL